MPLLCGQAHLKRAARECMRRSSAPGADGVTWAQFRQDLDDRVAALGSALRDGTWEPGPLRPVLITNYIGKQFTTWIPPAADRVVHRAMRRAIEPVLEERAFADWASGFRAGRNRVTALRDAARHLNAGLDFVADTDVARASAGATAGEVTGWLAEHVADGAFLARFRTALAGLPEPIAPGSGLAPTLISLRLSRVDARLGGLPVVRFGDNYCVFTASGRAAGAALETVSGALAAEGLAPNRRKTRIRAHATAEELFLLDG